MAAIFLSISAGSTSAHEMWLAKHDQGLVLCYGHTGATHDDTATIRYDPAEVLRVECYDINGNGGEISIERAYPLVIPDSCAVTYVLVSSGYWTKTPFGTKRLPKDKAKSPLESWLSFESVKRIDAWSSDLAEPVTSDVELSPIENPLDLSEGKKVRLRVTLDGKPKPGLPVAYDGKVRGLSDEEGRVNIKLRHGGLQMIQVSLTESGDGVKTDEIIRTATLIFEIDYK